MKTVLRNLMLLGAVMACGLGVAGCKEEGALEKAGKEADKAMEKTADAAQDAADKVKEAVE